MSEYPQYGQPDPYGGAAPPPGGYGTGPYGGPTPPAGALPSGGYAGWGKRVGAYLIDGLIVLAAGFPIWIGYGIAISSAISQTNSAMADPYPTTTTTVSFSGAAVALILVGFLTSLGAFIWNTCLKGGGTGWSIGKGVMGIRLISERTGQPIGGGMAFVRYVAHILDALPCYVGYLWPLWDDRRQTFADKILNTVVIEQPKP